MWYMNDHVRGTHIGAMTGLRSLTVHGVGSFEDMRLRACASLTELSVIRYRLPAAAMGDVMPQLRVLVLNGVANATDDLLKAATGVRRLDLCSMRHIDGSCLAHMRRLRELRLWDMTNLDAARLAPLAGSLRELHVSGRFFDGQLAVLTGLRRLKLSHCQEVSVDAVRRMAMLRHLDVQVLPESSSEASDTAQEWRRMGREGVAALRAELPRLEDVRVSTG